MWLRVVRPIVTLVLAIVGAFGGAVLGLAFALVAMGGIPESGPTTEQHVPGIVAVLIFLTALGLGSLLGAAIGWLGVSGIAVVVRYARTNLDTGAVETSAKAALPEPAQVEDVVEQRVPLDVWRRPERC
jgi:hypothetical protein